MIRHVERGGSGIGRISGAERCLVGNERTTDAVLPGSTVATPSPPVYRHQCQNIVVLPETWP
jgi:hypothetical protein